MMDDFLLEIPDPFGAEFGSAPGEDGPLWKLVQDLGQPGGEQQIPLQQAQ
jgi:hypothetical protein